MNTNRFEALQRLIENATRYDLESIRTGLPEIYAEIQSDPALKQMWHEREVLQEILTIAHEDEDAFEELVQTATALQQLDDRQLMHTIELVMDRPSRDEERLSEFLHDIRTLDWFEQHVLDSARTYR